MIFFYHYRTAINSGIYATTARTVDDAQAELSALLLRPVVCVACATVPRVESDNWVPVRHVAA